MYRVRPMLKDTDPETFVWVDLWNLHNMDCGSAYHTRIVWPKTV